MTILSQVAKKAARCGLPVASSKLSTVRAGRKIISHAQGQGDREIAVRGIFENAGLLLDDWEGSARRWISYVDTDVPEEVLGLNITYRDAKLETEQPVSEGFEPEKLRQALVDLTESFYGVYMCFDSNNRGRHFIFASNPEVKRDETIHWVYDANHLLTPDDIAKRLCDERVNLWKALGVLHRFPDYPMPDKSDRDVSIEKEPVLRESAVQLPDAGVLLQHNPEFFMVDGSKTGGERMPRHLLKEARKLQKTSRISTNVPLPFAFGGVGLLLAMAVPGGLTGGAGFLIGFILAAIAPFAATALRTETKAK